MVPTVAIVAAFALPVEVTFPLPGPHYRFTPAAGGRVVVPVQYAIEVHGNPEHLRNYPWNGRSLSLPSVGAAPANPFLPPEKPRRAQPALVPPPDRAAERIKAIESVILDLKVRGGSAAVIEQLQHDLDELKAKQQKTK